ncbi:MAG: aldo/keto reductase [Ruminococcus bromii]|nr:aldo/keto reductase [Ruminococcus bromii]
MVLNEKYKLNNGTEIPKLGLGTWMIPDNEVDSAVKSAVKLGYRLIDTAQAYGNESGVGSGIRSCGVSRDEMFVTSKVAAENKTYGSALSSIDESLKKTGLDYLDLMIIHSPQPWAEFRAEKRYFEENKEVWRALEDACKAGKVKSIGVSNFLADDLQNILDDCKIKPAVNQILTHISNTPLELINLCAENGILCEAYSPIAHGEALKNRLIVETAAKYGVESAQLCVRYVLQLGMVALPKTANPEHMKSNADVDFVISDSDMDLLKNLEKIKDYGEYSFFPVFSGK